MVGRSEIEIQRSWDRCADINLNKSDVVEFNPVLRSELSHLLESNQLLISAANSHLNHLTKSVVGAGYVVLLTDFRGVALAILGQLDRKDGPMWKAHRQGVDLSESIIGTSAMACALAERRPINVFGADHYLYQNHVFHCSASPIIDPMGNAIGTVDITRSSSTPNLGALTLVARCARQIEKEIFLKIPTYLSIRLSPNSIDEGEDDAISIAFGSDGEIVAMNQQARQIFGFKSTPPTFYADFFEGQFGDFIRRIELLGGPVEICTHSGISLYAYVNVAGKSRKQVFLSRASKGTIKIKKEEVQSIVSKEFWDPSINAIFFSALNALKKGLPVLITGETGTGKDVVANELHAGSDCANGPLVAINCAAIPESLIEGELFGHVDGAFTGAKKGGAPGKVELANGGTLFLDEIGDMPLPLQARLLRVLEAREVVRLGSTTPKPVNIQLVCATHQNLEAAIREGRFRLDLYYRINGFKFDLLPLRQRSSFDPLIDYLLFEVSNGMREITPEARERILGHPWPGNVRELKNALAYANAVAPQEQLISVEHLPPLTSMQRSSVPDKKKYKKTTGILDALEREAIRIAMQNENGHVAKAAQSLGVSRATLYRWLKVL